MVSYVTFLVSTPESTVYGHMAMEGNYNSDFTGKDVKRLVEKQHPIINDWLILGITLFDDWKSFNKFFTSVEEAEPLPQMKVSE